MTSVSGTAVALATGVGLLTALLAVLIPGRLPEPVGGGPTPTYRELSSGRFGLGCGLLAAVATTVTWLTGPPAIQPLWWVLATLGVLLAAIDARTTWLPLPLTRLAWAAMLAAGVVAYALGAGWPSLLRAAAGAAIALLLYLVVWLASRGGFGFGDVRFAPLVGAPAAAHSWSLLLWALLLGSVAGAVWGLVRMLRGRRGPYPYAPWLLAGGYLACATAWAG